MKINNSAGKILYGMHFYPGLAQYNKPDGKSYKIFLNEETLRKMDPTFAGKPVFVEHVNEVSSDRNILKNEADGWVIESFFNQNDGKHWVKFIVVTDEGEDAIRQGFRLSNSYHPTILNEISGIWNNINYEQQVKDGIYEHLAIVKHPRYDESIIMDPEQFKAYNEKLKLELSKISNSKPQQENSMAIKDLFFKRVPIENSIDYEKTLVCLPKSKKEYSLIQIVNAMDDFEEKMKKNEASDDMKVKLHDGTICNVSDLVEKYKIVNEELKKKKDDEEDDEDKMNNEDDEDKDKMKNEDDEDDEDKMKKKKKIEEVKNKKMKNSLEDKENFDSLKNAHLTVNNSQEEYRMFTMQDKISRGKELF